MAENKVAIVNSSSFGKIFTDHMKRLEKLGEVQHFTFESGIRGEELAKRLHGYNIIISSVTPFFTKEFFDFKDELKLISRHGIGYNNIDLVAAREHNTIVSIVSALVERDAVAENNITNLMNILRKTSQSQQSVRNNRWQDRAKFVGNTLYGKVAGIIGVGNTGSCVAESLRLGFRCRTIGYDPYKSKLELAQFGVEKVGLDELLQKSDVICVCANLTEENYHMISTDEIAKMKEHVYISNSSRGALLDEKAIAEGLKTGKIAGLATDVLENEPGDSTHPYLKNENVVLTPHTSAYTMECLENMGDKCVTDCECVVKGKLPERSVQEQSKYILQEVV